MLAARLFLPAVLTLVSAACSLGGSGAPTRFYALSAQTAQVATAPATVGVSEIAVGPINLPDMFARPQIVTRADDSRVELAEFDRWAGDLGDSIQRVLIQNLTARLPGVAVTAWPWSGDEPQWQLSVNFFRFDGQPGKQARVAGDWRLRAVDGACAPLTQTFDLRPVPGASGYAAYVDSLSAALAQLSQAIGNRLSAYAGACHR